MAQRTHLSFHQHAMDPVLCTDSKGANERSAYILPRTNVGPSLPRCLPMSSDNGGVDAEATVEERELTHFSQADEFRRILLSDDFFPGGLQKLGLGAGSLEAEDKAASSDAKGEESMRRLTAIVRLCVGRWCSGAC